MWPITAEEDNLISCRDVISSYDFVFVVLLCLRVMYSFACICSTKSNFFGLCIFCSEIVFCECSSLVINIFTELSF